jgi:nitrogen fixation NifU-like protein
MGLLILGFDKIDRIVMRDMQKTYSKKALEHAMNPQNVGRVEEADAIAKVTGPCGDTMEISLKIVDFKVVDAKFWTNGCGASIACGSVTTDLIKGTRISEAQKFHSKKILEALDGLPESNVHCSVLASRTLKTAIKDFMTRREITCKP